MSSGNVNYALVSAGLWAGTAGVLGLVLGADISISDIAMDAGIMGASAFSADFALNAVGAPVTALSSAAAAGVMYTAIQGVARGSDAYITNFAFAAANDLAVQQFVPLK